MNDAIVRKLAEKIGVNWDKSKFPSTELLKGYKVELEHGKVDEQTNVTNDDAVKTIKIALAHLKERPDYYKRLKKIE